MNFIYLALIIICVTAVVFIVIRKIPRLSNLNTDELDVEKEQQKKKEIIMRKVEKKKDEVKGKLGVILVPLAKSWGQFQLKFRIYVGKIQTLLQHEQVVKTKEKTNNNPEEKHSKVNELIKEAEKFFEEENYEKAENSYITAISLENRCVPAYRGLGDTYLMKKDIEEARQTYLFLTRLEPDDDTVWVKLAEIAETQGDLEEAIDYYQKAVLINEALSPRFYHLAELLIRVDQPDVAMESIRQAVELEPQNPKYLDLLIETAIICCDKDKALHAYDKLRMVNPDNHKLDGFRDRIFKIG